mgnify:CR=1 FL=1|tara:strand:- start:823 stop:1347 length:525 start_codon:yes stop_codon:yes gene_type:complete
MKILHINGTAYGGAANFVVDLHNKLLEKEVESFIYFPKKRNIEKIIFPNSIFFKINSILKNIFTRIINSAADVLVAPSRTEAFGLVALEASACNTPSVVFDETGLVDIIEHKKNGYIANSLDTNDYAKGINWVLNEAELNPSKFLNCRKIVQEKLDINLVAGCYLNVYQNLLKK